jgi:signal transduction histidine kinase
MTVKVDLLGRADQRVAADLRATSQSLRAAADRQAWLYATVLAVVFGLTVALSLLIGRRMARQLRALRDAALQVADDQLPTAVERLQRATRVEDLDTETPPLPVTSRDEIGEVAGAFDKVHRVALRVAVEQAALRRSIAEIASMLDVPLTVARILVGDMANEGLVTVNQRTEPVPDLDLLRRVLHGLKAI